MIIFFLVYLTHLSQHTSLRNASSVEQIDVILFFYIDIKQEPYLSIKFRSVMIRKWCICTEWYALKTILNLPHICNEEFFTKKRIPHFHYGDVIMGAIASQITSLTIAYSTVYSDEDLRNPKAPRHWPLCGEFTGDRWIPCTNGQ